MHNIDENVEGYSGYAIGARFALDAFSRLTIAVTAGLLTAMLAYSGMAYSAHDAPSLVYLNLKISFELFTFTIPAILGLLISFIAKSVTQPFVEKGSNKNYMTSEWFAGFIIIFLIALAYVKFSISQDNLQMLGKNPLPSVLKEAVCHSHSIAAYKYPDYHPPQIVAAYNCKN